MPNFANPQNLNRYAFVLNNPLKYTDPSGHEPCDSTYQPGCTRIGNPASGSYGTGGTSSTPPCNSSMCAPQNPTPACMSCGGGTPPQGDFCSQHPVECQFETKSSGDNWEVDEGGYVEKSIATHDPFYNNPYFDDLRFANDTLVSSNYSYWRAGGQCWKCHVTHTSGRIPTNGEIDPNQIAFWHTLDELGLQLKLSAMSVAANQASLAIGIASSQQSPIDPKIYNYDYPPDEGWKWVGNTNKGSWVNQSTNEYLRVDYGHKDFLHFGEMHYDWRAPDGTLWRIFLDGSILPK